MTECNLPENKVIYLSQKPQIPEVLKALPNLQHISSLQDIEDPLSPLIIGEDKLSQINDFCEKKNSPSLFIQTKSLDLKKLITLTSTLPLAGVIHNEMSTKRNSRIN